MAFNTENLTPVSKKEQVIVGIRHKEQAYGIVLARHHADYALTAAMMRGVNIHRYPFDETAPMKTKLQARRVELRGRLNHASATEQEMRDQRMQFIGALDNTNYFEKTWLWNASRIEMPSTDIDLNKPQG